MKKVENVIQGREKFCVLGDIRSAMQTPRQLEIWGFPAGSAVKNLPVKQEMQVRFPGWEDPREGEGNPRQDSCLGNPMDRGAWRATVLGVAEET